MKLATWNVNSIRARLERVLPWLEQTRPDVLCLQETKVTDDAFPVGELRALGYEAACHGQRTYNGVAILSRTPLTEVTRGFGDGEDDAQARLIAATTAGVRVMSVYVPNGEAVGSEKFQYKLDWLGRLRGYLDRRCRPDEPVLLCGDFNVAPDDADAASPAEWADTVLCCPAVRAALEHVRQWGLIDAFRKHHPEGHIYTWWDYRELAFPRNDGLRLDHLFATAPLAESCTSAEVDRDERKGVKPSDHAPVVADFDLSGLPCG